MTGEMIRKWIIALYGNAINAGTKEKSQRDVMKVGNVIAAGLIIALAKAITSKSKGETND